MSRFGDRAIIGSADVSYLGIGVAESVEVVAGSRFAARSATGMEGLASLTAIQELATDVFQAGLGGLASIAATTTGRRLVFGG